MSKFSLKEGVIDHFQMFIDLGKLGTGSYSDAKIHSTACGETSYIDIWDRMMDFISEPGNEQFPPLFVLNDGADDVDAAKLTIDKILMAVFELDINVKIYPLEQLLFRMQKKILKKRNNLYKTQLKPIPLILVTFDRLHHCSYDDSSIRSYYNESLKFF